MVELQAENARLRKELARAEREIVNGRDRIGRLRRRMGLRCRQKRRFKITADSNHALPVGDNLLQQRFEASAPDRVWLTELTCMPTDEGRLYLWPASRTSTPARSSATPWTSA